MAKKATGEGQAARALAIDGEARADDATTRGSPLGRRHRRIGFVVLAVALASGSALEGLLGVKAASYLLDPLRRELWTLAHLHAAGLALVNLVYVPWAEVAELSAKARRWASGALALGTVLLPLGFFFGGIAHPEGDPSIAIVLVPIGALLVLGAAITQAAAAFRRPQS